MEVYCRASLTPQTTGTRMYQACVAFRERGERMNSGLRVAVGKAATAVVSRFVVVNGRKK